MRLDIGCGKNKKPGYIGLDRVSMPGVDIVCNLEKEKIPIEDNSIDEVYSMHFMEHVTDLLVVMEEVWRVSKNNAKITIAVPYFTSVGAFRDPTHKQFFSYDTNISSLPSSGPINPYPFIGSDHLYFAFFHKFIRD